MNLNQIEIILPWNSSKWAKISIKIDEKWDKNKNNGFGLEQPNLNENWEKLANIWPKIMKKWTQIEIMDLGSTSQIW